MQYRYVILFAIFFLCGVEIILASSAFGCRFDASKIAALDAKLAARIKCQPLVTQQLAASLDPNFKRKDRPLVISFHGSTATGKTWTHELLAHLLLPGHHDTLDGVAGYQTLHCRKSTDEEQVISDFIDSIMRHAFECKGLLSNEAIVVIEELEECSPRMIQRVHELFDSPGAFEYGDKRINLNQYIFILASNLGSEELRNHVLTSGSRNITLEQSKTLLEKHLEKHTQDRRLAARIDYYIPFLPFGRAEMRELIAHYIRMIGPVRTVLPTEDLLDFLADTYEYEQGFSRVGGNVRSAVVTYVGKPVAEALKSVPEGHIPWSVEVCLGHRNTTLMDIYTCIPNTSWLDSMMGEDPRTSCTPDRIRPLTNNCFAARLARESAEKSSRDEL
eukprot:TRINITY_DN15907_c0_g1::TRINITY_DN15907_c0_g1_i1::g.22496::m.22496 TRINITY_DN15907_c0_g1::TRINITY_DN15907_c0_g1_i1::g.22496  ORF type:complete len:389 (-),score=71.43,sp/Q8R1J9/TOR2A_MOUSE/24.65/3e-09,Torsin/PF06309.6/1.1e-06,AAA_5/PF07728.9/0.0019,AAA_5/PF07728.9/2e+03,AAA_2/PF07724.9/0.0016 TRINITY_DN15907_c0_g1_i1:753-1919(-)